MAMNRALVILAAAVGGLVMSGSAEAAPISIGINFGSEQTNGSLASTVVAGLPAVEQANWNNMSGSTGSRNSFQRNDGTGITTMSVALAGSSKWTYATNGKGFTGGNANLYSGYLETGTAGGFNISVTNVPFAKYDVYVYLTAQQNWYRGAGVYMSASSGGTVDSSTYYFQADNGPFTQALTTKRSSAATDGSWYYGADYAVFSGNSATNFTLSVKEMQGNAGIAGFQIVAVPEPATMVAAGGLALLALRRRRA